MTTPSPAPTSWPETERLDRPVGTYTQGALALSYPLPSGLDSAPQSRALTVVQPVDHRAVGATAEGWAARFLQAVLEVMSCERPLTQLIRWTDEQVYSEIARRRQVVSTRLRHVPVRAGRQQVATVHLCQVTAERAEISARFTNGRRSHALAARLDLHRGRWVCTAIEFE